MVNNFALIGAGGFVAPRHLKAIHDTQSRLIAAVDPHDSVGILDRYSTDVQYFGRSRGSTDCWKSYDADRRMSAFIMFPFARPNYLHDAHVRMALRAGADAICEKPLVINPWNLDQLSQIEEETGRRVFTILQLRVHPAIAQLKRQPEFQNIQTRRRIVPNLYYVARALVPRIVEGER